MRPKGRSDVARGTNGKQIDTWRYELPDGRKGEFLVRLLSDANGLAFSVTPNGPIFDGLSFSGTDLQALRHEVTEAVHRRIDEVFSADWRRVLLVEFGYHTRGRPREYDLGSEADLDIHLKFRRLAQDMRKPIGNRGEVTVLDGDKSIDILVRSHRDRYAEESRGAREINNRNMLFRSEESSTTGRILVEDTPQRHDEARALREALGRFTALLADRLSPASGNGALPAPDELVDLMREAVHPDCDVTEEIREGFRF